MYVLYFKFFQIFDAFCLILSDIGLLFSDVYSFCRTIKVLTKAINHFNKEKRLIFTKWQFETWSKLEFTLVKYSSPAESIYHRK